MEQQDEESCPKKLAMKMHSHYPEHMLLTATCTEQQLFIVTLTTLHLTTLNINFMNYIF